jgi:hypothetical protein
MTTKVWIGFSTTTKIMSRLIRWVTKGKSSHAWIRYWDATLERYMVIQAELHGYETIPWERWQKKNTLVAAYRPVEKDLGGGLRYIAQFLGADYDLNAALWVGLKRWFGKRFKRPFNSPGKLMCSEAVTRALMIDKVACVQDADPELISPHELRVRLETSKEFQRVA